MMRDTPKLFPYVGITRIRLKGVISACKGTPKINYINLK